MANKNDKVILGLKKEIEVKKALLAKTQKFVPKTNCSLPFQGSNINLHVADKETLLKVIANLKSLELGLHSVLPEEKLIINGYVVTDWLDDSINKFNNLNITAEKERLSKLESKLHTLLSSDTRVSLLIEDIKKSI